MQLSEMVNKNKNSLKLLLIILVSIICFFAGFWYKKVTSKPEIVTKIEVVEKQVTVESYQKDKNAIKITQISEKPDKTKETTIIEASTESEAKTSMTELTKNTKISQVVKPDTSKYRLGLMIKPNIDITSLKFTYGVEAETRLPVITSCWFGGFWFPSNKEFGAKVSCEL